MCVDSALVAMDSSFVCGDSALVAMDSGVVAIRSVQGSLSPKFVK